MELASLRGVFSRLAYSLFHLAPGLAKYSRAWASQPAGCRSYGHMRRFLGLGLNYPRLPTVAFAAGYSPWRHGWNF